MISPKILSEFWELIVRDLCTVTAPDDAYAGFACAYIIFCLERTF